MQIRLKSLAAICFLAISTCAYPAQEKDSPLVVIKADDLVYTSDGTVFGDGWNRFFERIEGEGIKVSIGIICNSLDQDAPDYFARIRALHDSGKIEFWNHGYTHARDRKTRETEFFGPSFETQRDTLFRSQALAKEKLGFSFASFGAPYNASDANTIRALREFPEITSWMYGKDEAALLPEQVIFQRWLNIEYPVHHPDFAAFKEKFLEHPNRPYYVLQGHPGGWDEAGLEQFVLIVRFLKKQGAVFLTPSELRLQLRAKKGQDQG